MAVNRQKIWQINFNKYNAVGGGLKCCHPLNYKNTTVNQSPPHVGERGNFLWIAQKKNSILLKKEIVPHYGTSFSNLASQHVAAKAGLEVAWVELLTERMNRGIAL